jgi:hypothetical protein
MEPLTGSDAPGLIVATVLSLAAVPGCLFLGFKIFGVSAGGAENQH